MDMELAGKRVLITGGSRGIGLACAQAFAAEGCGLVAFMLNSDFAGLARSPRLSWR